jgi:hypothetical protein
MDNVTGGRRKLRHEKLHNLYSSPNNAGNITMLNQRVWGEGTRNLSNEYKIMVKNLTGRDHLEDLNADGTRKICTGSGLEPVTGSSKHGKLTFAFHKIRSCLD